jgi:hypothetical protein
MVIRCNRNSDNRRHIIRGRSAGIMGSTFHIYSNKTEHPKYERRLPWAICLEVLPLHIPSEKTLREGGRDASDAQTRKSNSEVRQFASEMHGEMAWHSLRDHTCHIN